MRSHPVLQILLPYVTVGLLCVIGSAWLHASAPAIHGLAFALLAEHTVLMGFWLLLAAAGIDFVLATCWRKLRMSEVGAKSAAQLDIWRD
jgi:hypothetical protein